MCVCENIVLCVCMRVGWFGFTSPYTNPIVNNLLVGLLVQGAINTCST